MGASAAKQLKAIMDFTVIVVLMFAVPSRFIGLVRVIFCLLYRLVFLLSFSREEDQSILNNWVFLIRKQVT